VLANSNPATIMTDPEMADRTYIEPLTPQYLEEIIRIEAEMMKGPSTANADRSPRSLLRMTRGERDGRWGLRLRIRIDMRILCSG
jgi:hypothetical protein